MQYIITEVPKEKKWSYRTGKRFILNKTLYRIFARKVV